MRTDATEITVLMTADTLGGVWTYSIDLMRELRSHSVNFVLATMGGRLSTERRQLLRSLPNVELHESEFRLEWMEEPWDDVRRAGEWLLGISAKSRADVIHLNQFSHAALPWEKPVMLVAHSDVVTWWRSVHGSDPTSEWKRYRGEVLRGLQVADLLVTPSRSLLVAMLSAYGSVGSSRVIPNGRIAPAVAAGKKDEFVLVAGRIWDKAKNIIALREIARDLPWPVRIAGAGNIDRTGAACAKMDCNGVELIGHLSEEKLWEQYGRAAIYALPAKYEPFGLSVLEAAMSGCALVLGDIPSLRENWDDAAVFVEPRNTGELRDALRTLMEDPALRSSFALRALERSRRFPISQTAHAYRSEYLRLISGNARTEDRIACAS